MSYEKYNRILDQKIARDKIREGIEIAANAVSPTLGHSSRRILIDKEFGEIISADDGKTVLESINVEDPEIQLGVKVAIECAHKQDEEGDGTSSVTIILNGLVQQLLKGNEKEELLFKPQSGNNLK